MLTPGLSSGLCEGVEGTADIEPVVARIGDLRAAERGRCGGAAADRKCANWRSRTARSAGASRGCSTDSHPSAEGRGDERRDPRYDPAPAVTRRRSRHSFSCTSAAESRGWRWEILEYNDKERVGWGRHRQINGRACSRASDESGVHRVQRADDRESAHHTSTVTVAVLPEAEDVDVQVDETDLASTCIEPRAPAVSTSTKPARCASRTAVGHRRDDAEGKSQHRIAPGDGARAAL
jgi:peptide chain release factor 1